MAKLSSPCCGFFESSIPLLRLCHVRTTVVAKSCETEHKETHNGKDKLKKTPIRETKVLAIFEHVREMLLHTRRATRKEAARCWLEHSRYGGGINPSGGGYIFPHGVISRGSWRIFFSHWQWVEEYSGRFKHIILFNLY